MFVQPGGLSSLIFVVIIGVWAAYFIQYWVRRREHLATARAVDQFSESMRVLERRNPVPETDLSTPRRESYAVSSARASSPQLLVRRAQSPVAGFESEAPARGRTLDAPPTPRQSRTPGLLLLGSLVAFVVAGALAMLSLVPVWAVAAPLAVGMASFVRVRQGVRRAQQMRRAARQRPAVRPSVPVAPAQAAPSTTVPAETPAPVVEPEAPAPVAEPYDIQSVERTAAPVAPASAAEPEPAAHRPVPLVDEDDIPLTWDPVPVPRPTYTMKARATRPAPTAADLVGDADTEYAEAELPERRVAGA